jgi:hypothetical protein
MRISKTTALLFAGGLHLSTAFLSISIPSIVNANQTVQLTISNDLSAGSGSFDAQFTTFRIYLAIIAPSSSPKIPQPSCYLVNATSISTTSVNLTIPETVGPDGTAYHIATLEYSTHSHPPPPSSYEYTPIFTLYNTTSSWSPADLDGDFPPFPDLLPCTAYDCARQCLASSNFPANVNGTEAGFATTYNCMAACPNVTYPSWESVQKVGAAPGEPLAGDGNEGAETVEVAYASLLRSVSLMPTATANGTGNSSVSVSVVPTASATGKSEGAVVGSATGLGMWVGVAVVVIALAL